MIIESESVPKSIVIFLALTAVLSLDAAVARAVSVTPVTVSPLPGTPDVPPRSQVSFLGAPVTALADIVLTGSRSGRHSGKLEPYSSGNGGSFVPSHPFLAGEHVTVTAMLNSGHSSSTLQTSFTVADPYVLPSAPASSKPSTRPPTLQSFHSRPDLDPPQVSVTTAAADTSLGDIFISPDSGPGADGPMIFEPAGTLVWFKALPNGTEAANLRVQQYLGTPVLTWWQGQVVEGHGQGEDVIENSAYQELGVIHAGNGLYGDLHEFQITPSGSALITAYEPIHYNLSSLGGSANGLLDDGVVQEIDIKTGLVMFEWHALGHVSLTDSYSRVPRIPSDVFDFFHINSIQQQSNGDLLIGSRNTWTAYEISGQTGHVLWRLGGKHSSFTLGAGVHFAWQHDPEIEANGTLSVFDNEDSPPEATASRAVRMTLNYTTKTATLLASFEHPGERILSPSQGNVQALGNEDRFVGWGQAGYASEFSRSGQVTFDMHLPAPTNSYRAYRLPWQAQPSTPPTLAVVTSQHGEPVAYASWNGATAVASWRLLAGNSVRALKPLTTFPRTGFESEIPVAARGPYLQVQALNSGGQVLGTSNTAKG
jgi:Arylsulfotransferase (ASST)